MLYSDYLKYLAQPMPDISGIFTTGAAQPFIQPQPDGLEQVQEQIDMLEKYPVAYQPYMGGGGGDGGGYNIDDQTEETADDTRSYLPDAYKNTGIMSSIIGNNPFSATPGSIIGGLLFGPIGAIVGGAANKKYNQAKNLKEMEARQAEQATRAAAANPEVYSARKEQTKDEGGGGKSSFGDQTAEEAAYGSCFIAGTKITMVDGTFKNIEDIQVGDIIKGHEGYNEVIKLDPTLLGERKLYSFNDNEHYFFTSEHPFMTEEGWKSIKPEKTKERDGIELYNQLKGELKVGDKLVTEKGLVEIKQIKSKEINDSKLPLYNFNVSNDNSYIADGYVVHNKGGSSSSKIVCTMMNESYGFGSFRNKIWLKHSKGLAPEYQKGYHKIFLPLVKYSKQKGVTNKIVKNILEHIAVHRTIDIRQESRGKTHLLGRIYRKILEPICYLVGKHG